MKILLTNYSLELQGGSETWVMTMFEYLSKKHDVDVYTSNYGVNELIDADFDRNKHYDLAIINHNSCLKETGGWNISRRIFTSHGLESSLESSVCGADIYIAVSEEVQANMNGFNATVIRNPINTDYFTPSHIGRSLKNILFLNNHARKIECLVPIAEACSGYELMILSDHQKKVKPAIDWADLVISSGRGCYESLSCGKNVMIVNRFGYDGMVTYENIFELRKNNCSGRRFNLDLTAESIIEELDKYNSERNMRPYILEHNNIKDIAEKYLSL